MTNNFRSAGQLRKNGQELGCARQDIDDGSGSALADTVEHFAHNLKDWIDSFVQTFTKMQANGYSKGQLRTQKLDVKFFTQYNWKIHESVIKEKWWLNLNMFPQSLLCIKVICFSANILANKLSGNGQFSTFSIYVHVKQFILFKQHEHSRSQILHISPESPAARSTPWCTGKLEPMFEAMNFDRNSVYW